MSNILKKIKTVDFPSDQYVRKETKKEQIVLHHTVSSVGVKGDINWWLKDKRRIATAIIIHHDGTPYQCFSTKYWAYHLGVKGGSFLDMHSIGVEIDSAGGLKKRESGGWEDIYGRYIEDSRVVEYKKGFRGYYAFEKYTGEQIETLRQLLLFWNDRYGIPLDYNESMWDKSSIAIDGEPGIWAHVSFRSDKSDVHPQIELINMLRSLKT